MNSAELGISIVVPCYKSADCLDALASRVEAALDFMPGAFELILVDDGSPDGQATWNTVRRLAAGRPWIRGVLHRRNFGQDNAILTGIRQTRGEFVVVMDDDLQHDPADIPSLLSAIKTDDIDVVYAAFRGNRHKLWKRLGSWFHGKGAEWLIGKPPHIYMSSFKIIRGEVAREAAVYRGALPYLDPQLIQITNRLGQITVDHHDRYAGSSNMTFRASVRKWARLAFSFSLRPLQISMWVGAIFSIFGLVMAVFVVLIRLFSDGEWSNQRAGWASLMTTILTFGGLQMVFIGILGEYVGRTHITLHQAPQSSIAKKTFDDAS